MVSVCTQTHSLEESPEDLMQRLSRVVEGIMREKRDEDLVAPAQSTDASWPFEDGAYPMRFDDFNDLELEPLEAFNEGSLFQFTDQ